MLAEKLSGAVGNAANPTYIEDVFSTYLYTGVSQPGASSSYGWLTNNIDLLGKGGMIWTKDRSTNATGTNDNVIVDTVRGTGSWPAYSNSPYMLKTNTTAAQALMSDAINGVNNTGYYIGPGNTGADAINTLNNNYVSWTFRKQPKFFDIVTWTGDGTNGRAIAHALGSTPGCIMVKSTSYGGDDWMVYHRSAGSPAEDYYLTLNQTYASKGIADFSAYVWNRTAPTSTNFTVAQNINTSGRTYVAYIFAHDAGGFGLTGTDNVISCGSVTSGPSTVNLGWEPQWVMIKKTSAASNWYMFDNMRGLTSPASYKDYILSANDTTAESGPSGVCAITSTGFVLNMTGDWVYIAIRRGPMKVPTDGTKVFAPVTGTSVTNPYTVTTNFPVDLTFSRPRSVGYGVDANDRLRGGSGSSYVTLVTATTAAEATGSGVGINFQSNTSVIDTGYWSGWGLSPVYWNFRRAPSFFDEVCYTGTGSATTVTHNLGVAPTLWIVKKRSAAESWVVGYTSGGANAYLTLQTTDATANDGGVLWNNALPTSTVLNLGASTPVNGSGSTYVAYLFATCPGVSKVGSYTGNGSSQTINCGFTGGARFVMIKPTSTADDWSVFDTARGIVAGNDPKLALNTTTAEATSQDYIDADSSGFIVNNVGHNSSGVTYIYLAIA